MKRKIKCLLVWVVLLFAQNIFAQTKLTGKVVNSKNEPVAGITIELSKSKAKAVTASDGSFEIIASSEDESIIISAVNYNTVTIKVSEFQNGQKIISLQEKIIDLEEFVVIGNRKAQRSKYNSIVAVDVIKLDDTRLQFPQIGANEILTQLVPSFQAQRQSASDGTEHIDPVSLRGLGPDQTLVLINGKRRHTTSLINYQNTVGNGAVGTDLNAIPTSAISRIEVLKDGASAQYGSDAIAGVINIILKRNTGLTINLTGGNSTRDDGGIFNLNANYGWDLNKKGFLNLTFESNFRGSTIRTQNHDLIIFDQSSLGNFFAYPFTNNPAASRAFDDAQIKSRGLTRDNFNFRVGDAQVNNQQGAVNFGYNLSSKTEIYFTSLVGFRRGEGFGFRRLPSETGNVVAQLYPNGFQPTLKSDIKDVSFIAGIKQNFGKWQMDLSNTYGRNSFAYKVENSNNSSRGIRSPRDFDAGSHAFAQNTVNLDFSRSLTQNNTQINIGLGAEYRIDDYSITSGQEESWRLYTDNPNGVAGSQSFPGFSPSNEVNKSRNSIAVYADWDMSFNKKFLLDVAARFEHYSDFGSTLNGKIASRYNVSDFFAFRGSVSTGFRAPSLHQQYFSNFYTDIAGSGTGIVSKGIFPTSSSVAKAVGLPDLKQEKSINYSFGFTTKPIKNLVLTVDGYLINIKDRIVITSSISDPRISAFGVESGRFFTNAINTRTKGLDIVLTHTSYFGKKTNLEISLASNFNKTEITDYKFPASLELNGLERNDYFGPDQQSLIETNFPTSKHTLTLNLNVSKASFMVRNTYWGKVTRNGFPFGVVQEHKAKVTTDASFSYRFNSGISMSFGMNNLFDVFPDLQAYENSYFGVFKYAPVQMGVLGASYYLRFIYQMK